MPEDHGKRLGWGVSEDVGADWPPGWMVVPINIEHLEQCKREKVRKRVRALSVSNKDLRARASKDVLVAMKTLSSTHVTLERSRVAPRKPRLHELESPVQSLSL